jgi:hypothetical protein
VIPFIFNGKTKSDLGWSFLAVIETGRFKDWKPESEIYDERSEFWRQLDFVRMEVGDSKAIKWSVPDGTRDPGTGDLMHDDLVISAAFCAVLDEVATQAEAKSAVIQGKDALAEMSW